MATTVNLRKGDLVAKGFIGFSWTTCFFGFFVPFFRGDWKWLMIMVLADLCSLGIANIILCFIYNRIYTRNLLENKGYLPADDYSRQLLVQAGMIGVSAQSPPYVSVSQPTSDTCHEFNEVKAPNNQAQETHPTIPDALPQAQIPQVAPQTALVNTPEAVVTNVYPQPERAVTVFVPSDERRKNLVPIIAGVVLVTIILVGGVTWYANRSSSFSPEKEGGFSENSQIVDMQPSYTNTAGSNGGRAEEETSAAVPIAYGKIKTEKMDGSVNVRNAPSIHSDVLGLVKNGMPLVVYQVQRNAAVSEGILQKNVTATLANGKRITLDKNSAISVIDYDENQNTLLIRFSQNNVTANAIVRLGDVKFLQNSQWYLVGFPDGSNGWVVSDLVEIAQ